MLDVLTVEMGKQVTQGADLLGTQVDALIRRVAAKDTEFAKERRAWKKREAELVSEVRALKRAAKEAANAR